jgi:RNA polymerase-binding transcription factor DksA
MAAAKKSATRKSAAKKSAAAKNAATKSATKKSAAKKSAATKSATNKSAAKKSAATKSSTKKSAAKKSAAAKSAATKSSSTKSAAKKSATTKSAAKKSTARRSGTKRAASTVTTKSTTRSQPTSALATSLLSNDVPEVLEIPKPRGTTKDGIAYTKDFDVKFLKAQRDELEARRASELARATRLEDEATSLVEDGEMGDVQFDDEGGEGDTMVVQRDLDRVLSSQARQTIAEIDAALERIRLGTYGYSVVSGRPIPRERLEAIPETTVLAAEKVSGIGRR